MDITLDIATNTRVFFLIKVTGPSARTIHYTVSAADRGPGRGLGLPGHRPQQQRRGARREGDAVCLPAAAAQAQELLLQAAVSPGLFLCNVARKFAYLLTWMNRKVTLG